MFIKFKVHNFLISLNLGWNFLECRVFCSKVHHISTVKLAMKCVSKQISNFHQTSRFQNSPLDIFSKTVNAQNNIRLHNPPATTHELNTRENALSFLLPRIMHSEREIITPTIAIIVHCFHRVAVSNDIMVCWMHNDVNSFSFIIMHYFMPFLPYCDDGFWCAKFNCYLYSLHIVAALSELYSSLGQKYTFMKAFFITYE